MTGEGRIGGPRVVRRRYEERRKQEQEFQQSPPDGVDHQQQQYQQQQQQQQQQHGEASIEVGYHSDAHTMTSSTIISGGGGNGSGAASATMLRSPASSTRSTNTTSSSRRLSVARQNMMQRRIEARKRQEERQRELIRQQDQQQQQQQQQMQDQPHQYHRAHPPNNIIQHTSPVLDNQERHDQNQAMHPDLGQLPPYDSFQVGQHRPAPQPQHHSNSNWQNNQNNQQSTHYPHQGQHQHQPFKSQFNHPNINSIPSPPMVQRTQEPAPIHSTGGKPNGYSPSYDSYNMPIMANNNPAHHHLFHYQVYHPKELEQSGIIRNVGPAANESSSTFHPHHPPPHQASQQQCQQPMFPPTAAVTASNSATNRLRNYESPSDEWHGHHNDESGVANHSGMNTHQGMNHMSLGDMKGGNGGQQQRQGIYHEPSLLLGSNQYYRKQPLQQPAPYQPRSCTQAQPQKQESLSQLQHTGHNEHSVGDLATNVGNQGALRNNLSSASSTIQGLPRDSTMDEHPMQQHRQQPQSQSQTRNLQVQQPQLHHNPLHQPNWNDVNQLSRDDNRQRLYQRHLASRQKYQRQQRQEEVQIHEQSNGIPSQHHPHLIQHQYAHTQKHQAEEGVARQTSRSSSPRLSDLSPVEHLGNRTDYIQRKNKFVFPKTLATSSSSSSLGNNKRHGVVSNNDSCGASVVSEQARKFEEAALKQQQQLSRQRRIEQRRKIEDRWMNRRKDSNTVSIRRILPMETRGNRHRQHPTESHGYHSDGGSQQQQRRQPQGESYTGSEDQSIGSVQYLDAGYRSEGGEARRNHHRDEFQSSVDCGGRDYVDSDAITPQDARRRLWDENERLRVVLPRHESQRSDSFSPRDGLPDLPHRDEFASPGNHSGSSSAGGGGARFKSKFVHAAALAAQNRTSSSCDEWHHSQKSQVMQRECIESREELHQHQQFRDTKKNSTVVSHYTDSTAETTADITTNPGGSFGSSRNNSHGARKISLSPPRHLSKVPNDGNFALPSIDEQGTTPALPVPDEYRNSTISVADLIARINAVSRSNPEQALAAIDSIIKRESRSVERNKNAISSGTGICKTTTKITQEMDCSSANLVTPRSNEERKKGISEGVQHFGKDFFKENYEQILVSDSNKIIRATADAPGNRGNEDQAYDDECGEDDDDDDDSLLSSDESTVSSMTDPTYQSVKLKPTNPKDAPTSISMKERSSEHRSNRSTLLQPQKSWKTLKNEYTVRKLSPTENVENSAPLEMFDALLSSSRDEIKFKPDVEPSDKNCQQEHELNHDETITKLEKKLTSNGVVKTAIKTQTASNHELFGKLCAENTHRKSRERGGTSMKRDNRKTATMKRDASDEKNKSQSHLSPQSQLNQSSSGNALPTSSKTPEIKRDNKPAMRPDTPDLMMAVTSAFANVDISFGGAKSTSHRTANTTAAPSRPPDRPMPALISPESDDGEKTLKSFQTISDAFSDVDISFEQEKTVSQRRKELEYYSKSWTTSKTSSYDSGDNVQQHQAKTPSSKDAAATWAKSSLSKSRGNVTKEKKMMEPKMRLKGSKSLTQKFANLIKAFDD